MKVKTSHTSALKRITALTAASLASLLALSGCATTPAEEAAVVGEETAQEVVVRTLNLAIAGTPPSFDPAGLDLGESTLIWASVYDTLTYVDETNAVQPNIAREWSFSADGLTVTFLLRDDAVFSTGETLTAADAAATIEYSKATAGTTQALLSAVDSAEAVDDTTLVLTLNRPDASLLVNLGQSAGVIAPAGLLGDPSLALSPVGSGPYILSAESVTGANYILERRDDHWNVEFYDYNTVTLRVFEDAQAISNALQAGEIDSALIDASAAEAVAAAGVNLQRIESIAVGGIFFIDKQGAIVPALADVRVRQAINLAFDRNLIVEKTLLGFGIPSVQLFNPSSTAFNSGLLGTYDYDTAAAIALMAEAGYADGFAVKMPSSFLSAPHEPVITTSLGAIGIAVEWVPIPPQEIASSLFSGQYGLVFFFNGYSVPPRDADAMLSPSGFLAGGYSDDQLAALFATANGATDAASQGAAYQAISAYAVEQALHAPLFAIAVNRANKVGVGWLPQSASTQNLRFFVAE